ncbi:hypothetical protein VCRA2123O443_220051 [Vibrio crassostreae]|nr:hypothetical protein VCRA2110O182_220004 [Vibrio crassostreae]CAK2308909.1 hypothetical protein VCRA2111O408_220004 [Vibrio crassostreae]CAK2326788.1 hypothetical protein VCRA211O406_220050 [Vibrio crassostreae]CAK3241955.1 hypothetical protein VCRA2123O443_220051 [Vibrio crassostreae]
MFVLLFVRLKGKFQIVKELPYWLGTKSIPFGTVLQQNG